MTHKSLLAPPVCHVSAHNSYIKCFYELSWHGLFVTSGQHRGSAEQAKLQCVAFPGWGGGEKPPKFLLPGVEWLCWGSTLGLDGSREPVSLGGLWHDVSSRKRLVGILNAWGWRIGALPGLEDQGCSCPVILHIAMEVSPTPWLFVLKSADPTSGLVQGLPPHCLPFPAAQA